MKKGSETQVRLEILERACTKMKTSDHKDDFIRQAVTKGVQALIEKVKKSRLLSSSPGFQPLYQNAGWKRNWKARTKTMKRNTWYKEGGNGGMCGQTGDGKKRRIFQKAGR